MMRMFWYCVNITTDIFMSVCIQYVEAYHMGLKSGEAV